MDNRKFEQLIDLIINENEEQAKALFHDIVVEKSREIYESMMDEELTESGYTVTVAENPEHDGEPQVDDLMAEVGGDMTGQSMSEDDDEFADIESDDDMGDDMDGEEDFGGDDDMEMDGEEDLEDRVVDLEDKLDELMAEFEELMGQEGEEDMDGEEEDFGASDDEEEGEEDLDENLYVTGPDKKVPESKMDDDEAALEESVQLKKVPGLYGSNIGGDDGDNVRSVALTKPKVVATGAKPIAMGSQEAGKGGTQGGVLKPTSKTIPGTYKNAPGGKNFSEKGESVAKPAAGKGKEGQNNKSIVGESKKSTKQVIKRR
jgi:hypothetical protein